uniref:Uncharacterized protein n=1 Tax=Anabas testudineus TaxID=64144 RepID=A0A7N5ZY62_ANATE
MLPYMLTCCLWFVLMASCSLFPFIQLPFFFSSKVQHLTYDLLMTASSIPSYSRCHKQKHLGCTQFPSCTFPLFSINFSRHSVRRRAIH